jgi:hypothetical protein
MNKDAKKPEMPEDTFNGTYSAMPTPAGTPNINTGADQQDDTVLDFGEMNEEDAIESGYTDKNGKAIGKTRKDKVGSPTGAYTDIGAGRSSVVHHHEKS